MLEAKELKQLNYFLISLERQIMTVIRQGDVALTPVAKLPDGSLTFKDYKDYNCVAES
jgi:hypothetical protein